MLTKLVILLVVVLVGGQEARAYPVAKEQSQFLRKVGAALGDLAAVVLEMNDPYVLQRLSSKDQAHQFLVNILQGDGSNDDDSSSPSYLPRHELYSSRYDDDDDDDDVGDPRRRWSYMSYRSLEDEQKGAASKEVEEQSSEAELSSEAGTGGSSSPKLSSSEEEELVEVIPLRDEPAEVHRPVPYVESAPMAAEEDSQHDKDYSDYVHKSDDESSSSEEEEEEESSVEADQAQGNPGLTALRMMAAAARKTYPQHQPSAEVPCSDEDYEDSDSSSTSDQEKDDDDKDRLIPPPGQRPLPLPRPRPGKPPKAKGENGRVLLEQLVRHHLVSLLSDVTGKAVHQMNRKVHAAVDVTARRIVADVERAAPYTTDDM